MRSVSKETGGALTSSPQTRPPSRAVLQISNIAGVWFDRELGPYLAGLILLLVIALVQFCVLILSPASAEPPAV
jgi:hypothetical protein